MADRPLARDRFSRLVGTMVLSSERAKWTCGPGVWARGSDGNALAKKAGGGRMPNEAGRPRAAQRRVDLRYDTANMQLTFLLSFLNLVVLKLFNGSTDL